MSNNGRIIRPMMPMKRNVLIWALLAGACSGGETPTETPPPPPPNQPIPDPVAAALVVSDPVLPANWSSNNSTGDSTSARVAYVSLPPNTLPNTAQVTITNLRTSEAVTPVLSTGGFDPVAIPALPDDTLDIAVSNAGQATTHTRVVTLRARPPRVVRTNPPKGRVDVPLNLVIVIVFSEPLDPATLTPGSVQLSSAGGTVSGTLSLDPSGTAVSFQPDQPLQGSTSYQLQLTGAIKDAGGASLEEAVSVSFTTQAATPQVPIMEFHIEPPSLTMEQRATRTAVQFRALTTTGSALSVLWRLDNPEIGEISASGVFLASYGGGSTTVRALLAADPTQTASASVTIIQQPFAPITISAITSVPSGVPVILTSVTGQVDVVLNLSPALLPTGHIVGVWLKIGNVKVASVDFNPEGSATTVQLTLRWDTGPTPSGTYVLVPGVTTLEFGELAANGIPLVINHP